MTLYDPVLIITIVYGVAVPAVDMIRYYFLVILYIICYVIGYDAGIIVYCVIGYDEYDILY